MKNVTLIARTLCTAFVLFLLTSAFGPLFAVAGAPDTVSVPSKGFRAKVMPGANDKLFHVATAGAQGPLTVRIVNTDKQLLHEEKVQNPASYVQNYNLSALPEGTYIFEFISNGKMLVKPVEIRN